MTTRCDGCIPVHAKEALDNGASRAEISKALAVVISLNAAQLTYSDRVMETCGQLENK